MDFQSITTLEMFRDPKNHIAELAELLRDNAAYKASLRWRLTGLAVSPLFFSMGGMTGWNDRERVDIAYRKLLNPEVTPKQMEEFKLAFGAWIVALNHLEKDISDYIAKHPKPREPGK